MLETITGWIGQNGFMISVVSLCVALNVLLSGIAGFLGWLKDKTKWEGDNKAYEILHKVISFLQKIVDYGSANPKH